MSTGGFRPAQLDLNRYSIMAIETEEQTIVIAEEETDTDFDQPWNVIIYDDPVNLMSFVTLILRRIFGSVAGSWQSPVRNQSSRAGCALRA